MNSSGGSTSSASSFLRTDNRFGYINLCVLLLQLVIPYMAVMAPRGHQDKVIKDIHIHSEMSFPG